MFNKKSNIKEVEINNFKRYVIEYQNDHQMREILDEIIKNHNTFFLQYDTDMLNHNNTTDINKQFKELKSILFQSGIQFEFFKTKSQLKRNIFEKFLSHSKEYEYQYKLACIINKEEINQILDFHIYNNSNIHFGIDFIYEDVTKALKNFVSNVIDDENRFKYFNIDLFVNLDLKRIVFFSKGEKSRREAERIQKFL